MKSKIIAALKIILPLGVGVFLIWLFYDALCDDQKDDLFSAFGQANYFWVFVGVFMGWLSHMSRAYRWKYLLEPMGYKVKFWQLYHAVMIGYVTNLIFPRAGEAARAGVVRKSNKIPFEKGFGSIIAERTVDLVMLGIIALITLWLQFDKLEIFQTKIDAFNSGENSCANVTIFAIMGKVVFYGVVAGFLAVTALFIFKPTFRKKVITFFRGIFEGVFSIFKMKKKGPFLLHTIFIWAMYPTMFWINFYALDATSGLGLDAALAGFVAGAVAIVLVQGGIGVYPALVGIVITLYLPGDENGIAAAALALGWISWAFQNLMIIVLGLLSLALNGRNPKFITDESAPEDSE